MTNNYVIAYQYLTSNDLVGELQHRPGPVLAKQLSETPPGPVLAYSSTVTFKRGFSYEIPVETAIQRGSVE